MTETTKDAAEDGLILIVGPWIEGDAWYQRLCHEVARIVLGLALIFAMASVFVMPFFIFVLSPWVTAGWVVYMVALYRLVRWIDRRGSISSSNSYSEPEIGV